MILAVSGRLGDRLGSLGTKRTSFWASGRHQSLLHTHEDATLPSFYRRAQSPGCSCCRCHRRRSQSGNSLHDLSEQLPRDRDLGHLERDVATVADDLGTDFDQLLAKTCQRPLRNRLWSRERAEEVPEIVS